MDIFCVWTKGSMNALHSPALLVPLIWRWLRFKVSVYRDGFEWPIQAFRNVHVKVLLSEDVMKNSCF